MNPKLSSKVKVRSLKPSDYELGPSFTKEFSLVGKDKKSEKLRVMKKPSLFNKNFKVVSDNFVGPNCDIHKQITYLFEETNYKTSQELRNCPN